MAISKRTITVLVRNYLINSPRMQYALEARVMHLMDLFGRSPTDEECVIILRSLVITDYPALFADTVYLAKEEGFHYPAEYARQLLEDIAETDWYSLISIVRTIVDDIPLLATSS